MEEHQCPEAKKDSVKYIKEQTEGPWPWTKVDSHIQVNTPAHGGPVKTPFMGTKCPYCKTNLA